MSRRRSKWSRYPRLSAEVVANDSTLLSVVDTLFDGDYAKHRRRILAAQDRLQELSSEDGQSPVTVQAPEKLDRFDHLRIRDRREKEAVIYVRGWMPSAELPTWRPS